MMNKFGQLCLEKDENQMELKPQKTSFSNISKVSLVGDSHNFKTIKEKYLWGNLFGECGLGHFNFDSPQITPSLILNSPSNIVHFVCG